MLIFYAGRTNYNIYILYYERTSPETLPSPASYNIKSFPISKCGGTPINTQLTCNKRLLTVRQFQ